MPVLAVGGGSGEFTRSSFQQVAIDVTPTSIDRIGHYVAMETPDRFAEAILAFFRTLA
jgi:pimeloyl-ACP methyl ester carboxylesterase